jgi:hypothetical protein
MRVVTACFQQKTPTTLPTLRHGVETGTAKRMTPPQPGETESDADDGAVAFDGLSHVIATGRKKPTRTSEQR